MASGVEEVDALKDRLQKKWMTKARWSASQWRSAVKNIVKPPTWGGVRSQCGESNSSATKKLNAQECQPMAAQEHGLRLSGDDMPSGHYLVVLRTASHSEARTITVVR